MAVCFRRSTRLWTTRSRLPSPCPCRIASRACATTWCSSCTSTSAGSTPWTRRASTSSGARTSSATPRRRRCVCVSLFVCLFVLFNLNSNVLFIFSCTLHKRFVLKSLSWFNLVGPAGGSRPSAGRRSRCANRSKLDRFPVDCRGTKAYRTKFAASKS